jgi:hypothetical protein
VLGRSRVVVVLVVISAVVQRAQCRNETECARGGNAAQSSSGRAVGLRQGAS